MAGMKMRFIDDLKRGWIYCFFDFLPNGFFHRHHVLSDLADLAVLGKYADTAIKFDANLDVNVQQHFATCTLRYGTGATISICCLSSACLKPNKAAYSRPQKSTPGIRATFMATGSKYFTGISVKKQKAKEAPKAAPSCQWRGCEAPGVHKAPKGRGREGEFFNFCVKHVRHYNKTYNYFDGMTDEDIVDYQDDARTGHRPTWSVGSNSWAHGTGGKPDAGAKPAGFQAGFGTGDNHGLFGDGDETTSRAPRKKRTIRNVERKALTALNLDVDATKDEIKTRFKELVKRHHPDSNAGDGGSEDKLREVIQAYNYLKQAGLC